MRTPRKEKTSLKKGAWTLEEDEKLKAYITRYGIWNWTEMPKFAGLSRSGKSCRLRWMNYLRPDIKRENFTKKEEETIINLHSVFGNSWSAIANKLPGRINNHVKNYWHTYLKKHVEENNEPSTDDQQQELRTSTLEAHVENVREPNTFTDNLPMTPASEDGSSLSSTSSTTMCDRHDTIFDSAFEFQIDQEWYQDNLAWFYGDEYWSNLLLQAEMAGVMEQPIVYF